VTAPYFDDGTVTLYLGKCEEIAPELDLHADAIVTDPPYGETSLKWDRWVDGWVELATSISNSMWCFGSMRMFLAWRDQFIGPGWKMSQDIVWEKSEGTSLAADRFRRVHEHATHWYRGEWRGICHEVPRDRWHGADNGSRNKGGSRGAHLGEASTRRYDDDGTRLMRSVQRVANMRQRAIAPTEKPVGILEPLIRYACPPGGLVVDLFAGSGSTLEAARQSGRRAVGIEADEAQIEKAAARLSQTVIGAAP
jgi:site-specific DNA-methyltransferase (adenine-specific)